MSLELRRITGIITGICWVLTKIVGCKPDREAGRGGEKRKQAKSAQATPHKRGWWGAAGDQQSVCQSISGLTLTDYIVGLQCAITVRSAFSLRYIMMHAENVIKILW